MRYFVTTYEDGSVCLDIAPRGSSGTVRELTEDEARDFYHTAPSIDTVESSIADKFDKD